MEKIVYGSEIAKAIKEEMKANIEALEKAGKRLPHLVVILIGNDVGSCAYVKGKESACHMIGMKNTTLRFDEKISEETLLAKIDELNKDNQVDGILVQLPLPKHIDEKKVLFAIDPTKDVDGFHPFNMGKMQIGEPTFLPCTPKGVMRILKTIGYDDLSGLHAVVIGRSNIVGKPIAQMLLNKHATLTIAHSKTKDIKTVCATADIVVVAVGVPKLIKADWLKQGAVVIDVGMNRNENNKLCGDVDFDDCLSKVKYITPVPKGVGPMTIAMLLENTLESYYLREKGEVK
ncbi:MAG: bifunctional methylenetetrahydrofolate dehydrogenase/methenyltetrahydrofolate cyclohydrolase FolD [Erysipelotrichia bacterium]|nr:bifunctional methylenetetrahydrofolate dehydrogenase/methenyltetrahydrofolate cyclohydrolase FolD [Erysipelotrichia bacterium]NCC54335.1 bifunctional methylenetetrahydrofolate dehydrogenase/methenyltetrahydrofolate cyclohydrolase FolD [Erysipelotrichia bacterium]